MQHNNQTFLQKTIKDISKNIKICGESLKKCCEKTYEKMHHELTKTRRYNRNVYRNLNLDYSNLYYEDDDEEQFNGGNIYDANNINLYHGFQNIWFTMNKVRFFENSEPRHNTINILKARMGYCLISRSCVKRNILAQYCYNINGYKLTNNSKLTLNQVVHCKFYNWKYFCLGSIIKIRKNYDGELIIDIKFPSCPDSDIILAWHFNNSIEKNKNLLRYSLPNHNLVDNSKENTKEYTKENNKNNKFKPRLETIEEEKPQEEMAAFLLDEDLYDSDMESNAENEIIGGSKYGEEKINLNNHFVTPLFIGSAHNNNEIIKYNVFWLNNDVYNSRLFKRKQIVVSSRENVKNPYTDCLPNVKIIPEYHMKNILNIHQRKHSSLKVIKTHKKNVLMNMLEPQNLNFFKYNRNYKRIAQALNRDLLCTYTGRLCYEAKKYLLECC